MDKYWLIKPDGTEVGIDNFSMVEEYDDWFSCAYSKPNGTYNVAIETKEGENINIVANNCCFWLDKYGYFNWEFGEYKIITEAKKESVWQT